MELNELLEILGALDNNEEVICRSQGTEKLCEEITKLVLEQIKGKLEKK